VQQLPFSAIVPSAGRFNRLAKTLTGMSGHQPTVKEVVVVGAGLTTHEVSELGSIFESTEITFIYEEAKEKGAASQRNQAFRVATQPFILFMDDDVDMEANCLAALWKVLCEDRDIGGVNAHISNQSYSSPGRWMRAVFTVVGCPRTGSLAGRCCGPALNFLPDLRASSEAGFHPADWLNTTCTLYRRESLPLGLFPDFFRGYSLMEDVGLSLVVGRQWKLATANQSRIYHDSKPAAYKCNVFHREKMEFVNRYYVMTRCFGRRGRPWVLRHCAMQFASMLLSLRHLGGWRRFPILIAAKVVAVVQVMKDRSSWSEFET
jgi:GT2 family glycosyltransferase